MPLEVPWFWFLQVCDLVKFFSQYFLLAPLSPPPSSNKNNLLWKISKMCIHFIHEVICTTESTSKTLHNKIVSNWTLGYLFLKCFHKLLIYSANLILKWQPNKNMQWCNFYTSIFQGFCEDFKLFLMVDTILLLKYRGTGIFRNTSMVAFANIYIMNILYSNVLVINFKIETNLVFSQNQLFSPRVALL